MSDRFLVFLSISIAGTGLLLLQTYRDFANVAESLMTLLGIVSSGLAIYEFLRRE